MATELAGWSSLSCSCPQRPTINGDTTERRRGGRLVSVKAGEGAGQTKKLLCLSNGHGEDEVAVSVLKVKIAYHSPTYNTISSCAKFVNVDNPNGMHVF